MSLLLSETSSKTTNHTELAQVVARLPRLTCDELRKEAGKAFGSYLRSNGQEINPDHRDRVAHIVKGIAKATNVMLNYVVAGNDEQDPPRIDRIFSPVDLRPGVECHEALDKSMQFILGKLACTEAVSDKNATIYPLRIATGDDSLDLIPEISRLEYRSPTHNMAANECHIIYDLHFASYEVV